VGTGHPRERTGAPEEVDAGRDEREREQPAADGARRDDREERERACREDRPALRLDAQAGQEVERGREAEQEDAARGGCADAGAVDQRRHGERQQGAGRDQRPPATLVFAPREPEREAQRTEERGAADARWGDRRDREAEERVGGDAPEEVAGAAPLGGGEHGGAAEEQQAEEAAEAVEDAEAGEQAEHADGDQGERAQDARAFGRVGGDAGKRHAGPP
jgi:hypothetical protein